MGLVGDPWLHSMSALILQQATPGFLSRQCQSSKRESKCSKPLEAQAQNLYNVTSVQSKSADQPDPRGKEVDFLSYWEEPQNHSTRDIDMGKAENWSHLCS